MVSLGKCYALIEHEVNAVKNDIFRLTDWDNTLNSRVSVCCAQSSSSSLRHNDKLNVVFLILLLLFVQFYLLYFLPKQYFIYFRLSSIFIKMKWLCIYSYVQHVLFSRMFQTSIRVGTCYSSSFIFTAPQYFNL